MAGSVSHCRRVKTRVFSSLECLWSCCDNKVFVGIVLLTTRTRGNQASKHKVQHTRRIIFYLLHSEVRWLGKNDPQSCGRHVTIWLGLTRGTRRPGTAGKIHHLSPLEVNITTLTPHRVSLLDCNVVRRNIEVRSR